MEYTKQIQLDVNAIGMPPVVRIKQGDGYSRFIRIQLMKDGVNYTPENGVRFLFRCQKPDGHAVLEDSVAQDPTLQRYLIINQGSGVIQIELIDQVSTAVGTCRCDLCLIKDEKVLSSMPFVIEVIASPDVATLAVSTDDFRTLSDLIAEFDGGGSGGSVVKLASITLPASSWSGASSPYSQTLTITGATITSLTKVDLCASTSVVESMMASGTQEIVVVNNNGTLTAYAIGNKPSSNLTLQATLSVTLNV